jgi:glycosyltransferase involved in cell wall biosynthesis
MKTLIVSTDDGLGGAGKAAYRLLKSLQKIHADATMLVEFKTTGDESVLRPNVFTRKLTENTASFPAKLFARFYPAFESKFFEANCIPNWIEKSIAQFESSIVHMHWISRGFIPISSIPQINKPIVWTLHDMWGFTGGCHYTGDCNRYSESCGACPQLGSSSERDVTRWIWKRKQRAYQRLNLTLVTPSHWLADRARESSLFQSFRIEVIPNGLDLNTFKPIDKRIARDLLSLPQDKMLILFGSYLNSDPRKGFQFLQPAIKRLSVAKPGHNMEAVIFGATEPANPPDLGMPVRYLGRYQDELSMALTYSAADVFVAPSVQDNLPNTVMEASACATPSVAFNVGGLADLVEHERTGYLARPFEVDDLAYGLSWLLNEKQSLDACGKQARKKVECEFEASFIARRHQALYEELLS